jgi:hypothetical protein
MLSVREIKLREVTNGEEYGAVMPQKGSQSILFDGSSESY